MTATNVDVLRTELAAIGRSSASLIAYRAAMRVLHCSLIDSGDESTAITERRALAAHRACLTAGVSLAVQNFRDGELEAAIIAMYAKTPAVLLTPANSATDAAILAIAATSSASNTVISDTINTISRAEAAVFVISLSLAGGTTECVRQDIRQPRSLSVKAAVTLPPSLQAAILHHHSTEGSLLTKSAAWTFWADWYARAMVGDPMPWEMQKQIALIPDDVWEAGPEAVAAEIARIEAEFALRERIAEFEAGHAASEKARLGIGGNSPPKEIDDPVVAEQVVIIWDSVAGLKEEVEAEETDAGRVAKLIEQLGEALKAVLAWCGRKGDLAVETTITATIKWSVPAVGGGVSYALLNPAGAEAVLKSAQTWLSFLLP